MKAMLLELSLVFVILQNICLQGNFANMQNEGCATIDECAIATGDRELCMYQGVPQTSCEREGCCFDTNSSSCYFSNAEVAGFKRRKGYCQGDDISTGSVMTLSQCSNACLRNSSYVAFLFDGERCKLLTSICKQTRLDNNNIYMYDQLAAENSVCALGDCDPNPLSEFYSHESQNTPATCGIACAADQPRCAAWVTLTNVRNDYCYLFSSCPTLVLRNIAAANTRIYSCRIYHEIQETSDTATVHDTRLLTDGSDTSCLNITGTDEPGISFRTKFPWPVLESASQTFTASLVGNNMQQCLGSVRFETPLEGEQQRDTGRRRQCTLTRDPGMEVDTGRVACDFTCTCGVDVCSVVYLSVLNQNVGLCEVAFN